MRLAVSASLLVIACCVPAWAQQHASHTEARQKLDKVLADVRAAYEKNDADAFAKLFTEDAVFVSPAGKVFRGPHEIEQETAALFKQIGPIKSFEGAPEEAQGLSDGTVWAVGRATIRGDQKTIKDHWAAVDVPSGDGLKIRMLSIGLDLPPPQPQTAQSPSTK